MLCQCASNFALHTLGSSNVILQVRNETQNCGPVVLGGMLEHMAELDQCNRILLIACGSSFHACLSSRDIMQTLTGKPVHCEVASDLLDRGTLLRPSDMCLFMSQSGETADTLQVSHRIKMISGMHHPFLSRIQHCIMNFLFQR